MSIVFKTTAGMEGKITILLPTQKHIFKGQGATETKEQRDAKFHDM